MTFLKLLGKISTISILLLVPFLLGADKRQPASNLTIAAEQKFSYKYSIYNSNINSEPRLIDKTWLIAQRQPKVALVIGNSSYEEAFLPNPVNDATDVAAALKNMGFELINDGALLDLNKRQMNDAIDKFREKLSQGAIGTFYYAGHGIAIEGVNYLIPINADLDVMADVDGEAIRLSKVLNSMESANTQFNFIIVDACRDNPEYRDWPSIDRSGSSPKGLAEEKPPRGTIILYSARYGRTAIDGTGRNSPFTYHLLQHIETRNLDIVFMIRRVTDGVIEATRNQKEPQEPWQEGSVRGFREFYLNPMTPPIIDPSKPDPILLSKTTDIDYSPLSDLLEAEEWIEADRETTIRMLHAAGREQEGWFRPEDLNKFSCEDLRIIDRLWLDSSQGKFGFSVQKEIWQNNGSPTADSPREIWRQFYIDIGWKTEESGTESNRGYVSYRDLGELTDILTIKNGNLPTLERAGLDDVMVIDFALLGRAANCNL
ncbi:MAG: GUN4 domain-containing protein [Prochloraceae cyanobacterium]